MLTAASRICGRIVQEGLFLAGDIMHQTPNKPAPPTWRHAAPAADWRITNSSAEHVVKSHSQDDEMRRDVNK